MELHQLSFGKAIKLDEDLAEIIVDESVVMNIKMVDEYHDWISSHLKDPCFLLINKVNSYTYTFDAQLKIATLPQIKAMAVVVYSSLSKITTQSLSEYPREKDWNVNIFNNRDDALSWLEKQH